MAKNNKDKQREYDAKRAGQRTRNWTVIFYPEDLPEDWKARIDKLGVKWVEGPLHDRDVNSNGEPKKPHVHTVIIFESVKTAEQVTEILKGVFGEAESGAIVGTAPVTRCLDRCGMIRYMAHLDNPDKAQYDVKDIIGHNGADPAEMMRYTASETRMMIIAMEEFIEDNGIVELADFSRAIRYDRPEWHTILSTKMTTYFNAFIRSRRHKAERNIPDVDPKTGEVIDRGK